MIYLKALAELGGDPRLGRWLCLYKAKTSVALFFFFWLFYKYYSLFKMKKGGHLVIKYKKICKVLPLFSFHFV